MWCLWCWSGRRLLTLLLITALVTAVAPGSLRPLIDPVPASATAHFVLQLTPQVDPPAGVTRTKVVLQDLGFDLTQAGASSIVSTKGLSPVLQVGGLIGDGPAQLSLLLDAPLVRGSTVEILLSFDARNAVPRIVALDAKFVIRCSIITRPNMFDTVEQIPIPLDAEVREMEQGTPPLHGMLLMPSAPSQVSTPRTLSLVQYQLRLNFGGASEGDVLQVVPLAALHNDFQVPHGSDCPQLVDPGVPIGVHMPWQTGGCRFVRRPPAPRNESHASNAIEIVLASGMNFNALQTLVLALPAPTVGSGHPWLLVLTHAAGLPTSSGRLLNASSEPEESDEPGEEARLGPTYDIFELGKGASWRSGLAIEPRPQGSILAVSSRSLSAVGATVDLSVVPDVDLRGVGESAMIIRPTTDAILITACQDVEYLSGEATAALVVEVDPVSGLSECRVPTKDKHFGPAGARRIRLVVDGQASSTAAVAFVVMVTYAPGQVSSLQPLLGQYAPSESEELGDAKISATGSLMGRPTVFLITFRTSAVHGGLLAGSDTNTTLFPAWRAPTSCPLGCARWSALSEDGSAYPQGNANLFWGAAAEPPAGAGRACARPAAARREGPWCFCRGQLDKSWGYCEAEVSRLRLRLLDASKWRLLRARDGAKLSAIPEAHAADCALYLRDISTGSPSLASATAKGLRSSPPAPRRCWGDSMQGAGDSVFIEWWPGLGLEAKQTYALEVVGMFLGSVPQREPPLLNVAVMSSTTEGPYLVLQEANLGSDASSIKESGSQANLPQQPTVSRFSVRLLEALPTSPPTGRFELLLLSGGDESQWLLAGHLLDLFFHPLSAWDVAAEGADCPPLELVVANPGEVEPTQPVCRSYSIGGAAVHGRHNAIRLVLGEDTVISAQAPSFILTTLPLPTSGVLGARFAISVRHQDQFGEAAWYKESDTQLTWKPRLLAAGLMSWTKAVAGASMTVRLAVVPATTVRGSLREASGASSFARLRVMPPAGFVVRSLDEMPENASSSLPVDIRRSRPITLENTGESSGSAGSGHVDGTGFEVAVRADSILFAGAWYTLQLHVIASPPSRAQQQPWYAQLVAANRQAVESIEGPVQWFESGLESGSSLQQGIPVPGPLRASVVPSTIHASAVTKLAVYFWPNQTYGIFFRYIVLTAPRGFDFATVRGPGRSAAGTDGVVVACKALPRLALPLHIQCRPERASHLSESQDVAVIILPPLSQLGLQPYGFIVEARLPPFSTAWVEEASGRSTFSLETRTEDGVTTDTLAPLPSADWPDPRAPPESPQLLLPVPLPVYPRGCASARVHIDGLPPEKVSAVRLMLEPGVNTQPPIYMYVHAPLGYSWHFGQGDWKVSVSSGGNEEMLSYADFKPTVLPNGMCIEGLVHVLCMEVMRPLRADETYSISALIRTPFENPDVPQVTELLPSPALWHITGSTKKLLNGSRVPLGDRLLGCLVEFQQPNRIRRIYTAEATPSNTVVRRYAGDASSSQTSSSSDAASYTDSAEDLNDVAIALTIVTSVPRDGGLVVTAPTGAFAFPTACELADTPATATSSYGLPLPQSAGAECQSSLGAPHIAIISFKRGALPPNSYLFTIKGITNVRTIDEYDEEALWQVHTVADISVTDDPNVYLDHPLRFTAFSVLEAMEDAFIDTDILDLATTHFTKRRSAINEVVLCFRQSVATPAGQTLAVYLPDGFRIPWKDSDDCLVPDTRLGVAPVEISRPFGNVTIDPSRFTTLPSGMQVSCASSTDGGIAYLTLSLGLVEISRYYALRLLVQNADRSPPSNVWRLALGRQASRPIPGFTMQAFIRLDLNTSVSSAAQELGGGPPNIVQVRFQPSVPVPAGGAMRLLPPEGFELVSSVPSTSQGILVRASARCVGDSLFLGTDYSYTQCEATCRQRTSCTIFSVGFGTKSGECIQEEATKPASGEGPPTCAEFVAHSSFNVYRIAPSGDCFRFTLLEGPTLRRDIDCSLRHNTSTGITSAVFQLSVTSPPLDADQLYVAAVAVRNPTATPNQNVWGFQSFSQASLSAVSLLDDGIADGFELTLALDYFRYSVSPEELQHTVGAEVTLSFHWASSVAVRAGIDDLDDILRVDLPGWLQPVENVCDTLSTDPPQGVQHTLSDCGVSADRRQVSLVISGPVSILSPGSRLDFSFNTRNPSTEVVKNLPRDEVALVSLTHIRPVVSTVTGKRRNTTLASASAAAHTVQLPLRNLVVRQTDPPFSVAGHRPMTLEVEFQPQSFGADQIWISTSLENPLDFSEASCTVSSTQNSSGESLFGQFSCTPRHPVILKAQGRTHLSQLRVDAQIPLIAGQLYRLTVGGVGSGLLPGPVLVNVSTSNSELSADYRDYTQALLLDSLRGATRLTLAGRLALRPLGAGSFVALSASAEFGAAAYVASDHVHFVTMAFALDVRAVAGDRLILYPSSQLNALDGSVRLGLSAANLPYNAEVKNLIGQDDIFQHAKHLGLPRPSFRQRVDVLILAGRGILAGQTASLRLQAMVLTGGVTSAVGVNEWLMLVSKVKHWSENRDAISNSNQQEWSGGALSVVPAFSSYASMLRVSGQQSIAVLDVTAFLAPTVDVPHGRTLRISAPSMFIWSAECVVASSPMVLVQPGQCWRDGKNPHIVLLPLNAALRTFVVHELVMKVITPSMIVPPNLWEFAVLKLPSRGGGETDPWLRHSEAVPEQVFRLFGFELGDLQASLEPQAPVRPQPGQLNPTEHSLLLSLRLSVADGNELRLQAAAPILRIVAPYPLVVECPAPKLPSSGVTHSSKRVCRKILPLSSEPLRAAWDAVGGVIEYPEGLAFAGAQHHSWVNAQLIGLHQTLVAVRRCVRKGWRGHGGLEAADGRRSSIELELLTALPRDQWLVLPLLTRLVAPAAGSLEASADEFSELSTPFKFWRVELNSAIDQGVIQVSDTVRLRPAIVLNPSDYLSPGGHDDSPVASCASTEFCAEVAGVPHHGGMPPQFGIQLDRGEGISVRLELSFPRALPPAPSVPVQRLREAFQHKALGSPFPAAVILGSYIEITIPVPLRWHSDCLVDASDMNTVDWRLVCFESTAYLFVVGAPRPAGYTNLTLSTVSLIDPLAPEKPLRLPMSDTWVLSLVEFGVLRGQRLVESKGDPGLARFEDHGLGTAGFKYPTYRIGVDATHECIDAPMEEYLCPAGMYASGSHAVRLGGVDSWLDSMQLLCREELDVKGNYMEYIPIEGVSTVAGDVHFGSRANEDSVGAKSDHKECAIETASLVVGGQVEVWRQRQIMGLTLACLPRASVERHIPWDPRAGSSVSPDKLKDGATQPADQLTGCYSDIAVGDTIVLGDCEEIPDMRFCPQDPSLCCCVEGFSYNELARRCEQCSGGKVSSSGPLSGASMRICPVGSVVIGFRAATLRRKKYGGQALAIQNDVSSVCAIELICQAVRKRRSAGPDAKDGIRSISFIIDKSEADEGAVTDLAADKWEWWQLASAGFVVLVILRIFYVCCCKRSGAQDDYIEDEDEEIGTLQAITRRLKRPFVLTYRILIKPVLDLFKKQVWNPLYLRILLPAYYKFIETRCYRFMKRVALFMFKWVLRLCPWFVWVYKCCKYVKRKAKNRLNKTDRGSYSMLSPTSMKKRWDEGTLSPAGSPRRLARELQKRIRDGALSPRSMKAELAKLYARGELDQEAYDRRNEVLELALSEENLQEQKNFVTRLKSLRKTEALNPRNIIPFLQHAWAHRKTLMRRESSVAGEQRKSRIKEQQRKSSILSAAEEDDKASEEGSMKGDGADGDIAEARKRGMGALGKRSPTASPRGSEGDSPKESSPKGSARASPRIPTAKGKLAALAPDVNERLRGTSRVAISDEVEAQEISARESKSKRKSREKEETSEDKEAEESDDKKDKKSEEKEEKKGEEKEEKKSEETEEKKSEEKEEKKGEDMEEKKSKDKAESQEGAAPEGKRKSKGKEEEKSEDKEEEKSKDKEEEKSKDKVEGEEVSAQEGKRKSRKSETKKEEDKSEDKVEEKGKDKEEEKSKDKEKRKSKEKDPEKSKDKEEEKDPYLDFEPKPPKPDDKEEFMANFVEKDEADKDD